MRLQNKRTGDYEEAKEDGLDHIITLVEAYSNHDSESYPKEIVEKLKAWKRLKDKGFRFNGYGFHTTSGRLLIGAKGASNVEQKDLDLLFGGEE